ITHKEELARQNLERSLALRKHLAETHPKVPSYQNDLTAAEAGLGNLYLQMGQLDQAEKSYLQASEHLQRLVDSQPKVPDYQNDLAGCQANLGEVYRATGRLDKAEQVTKRAMALWQRLTSDYPELLLYAVNLG